MEQWSQKPAIMIDKGCISGAYEGISGFTLYVSITVIDTG